MKRRLIILLVYSLILQTGITDSTCPRGGYRNEQLQFGPNCMYKCNCKNNSEQCEEASGQCTSGCADGWMGPGCQYGDVAFRKPATQSSSVDSQMNNNPALVVDGDYSTCSNVTSGSMGTWWEVNLEKEYKITGLIIAMYKTYYNQTLQVEIKNSSVSIGRYCVSDGGFTPSNHEIQISCKEDIYGSIVKISSLGSQKWVMLCDLGIFGGRNLAYRRNSIQSSTRYATGGKTDGWAELGVDGGTSPVFIDGSCTHTDGSVDYISPWWRVDLGHEVLINQISIMNKLGNEDRLSGFKVKFWVNSTGTAVYIAPIRNPGLYINVTDFSSSLGESISIELSGGSRENPRYLLLCEVFVFGECLVNQCGWECEKSCYCKSTIVGSNKVDGTCPDENCLDNWTGTNLRCDYCLLNGEGKCPQICNNCETGWYCFPETATCLPICNENHWGLNCSRHCGNCISGDKCNQITGRCPGQCQAGWWNKNCSSRCSSCKAGTKCDKDSGKCEICEDGKWGVTCDKICGNCAHRKCNIVVGLCEDRCINSWWNGFCNQSCDYCETGTICNQESGNCTQCPTGKWDRKCSQSCIYCAIDTDCDIDSGECKRCPHERWGSRCSESCEYCAQGTECDINNGDCLQCEAGLWSLNCSLKCGQCSDDGACDIKTAQCIQGCLPSRQGDNCTLDGKITPEASEKGVVIGVSVGTVLTLCFVVVLVVLLVIWKRRENILKKKMREKSVQESEDGINIVYTPIVRSLEEHRPGYSEHEYAHIIQTNSSNDVDIGRRQEDRYEVDNDNESNYMTPSLNPESNPYYNGVEVYKIQIPLANHLDSDRSKAYHSDDLEYDNIRVELSPTADTSWSDYINTCFRKDSEKDKAYIPSQDNQPSDSPNEMPRIRSLS